MAESIVFWLIFGVFVRGKWQDGETIIMKNGLNIAAWVRQVIGEVNKVTWPTRQETMMATLMVLLFSVAMAMFLLLADQIIARLIKFVLGGWGDKKIVRDF